MGALSSRPCTGAPRPAPWLLGITAAVGIVGCITGRSVPVTPPSAPASTPATSAPDPDPPPPPSTRYFPGPDGARTARARRPTAVLLFAPPSPPLADGALVSVETLRFQPIVCSLRGKLAVGARCGEVMPARATVRLTDSGDPGREELELVRSTVAFRDEAGGQVYPAPYGPSCCMYNTCVGRTVPYYPRPTDPRSVLVTTKTVLAVWPADAEIDLTVFTPGLAEDVKLDDAPWLRQPVGRTAQRTTQSVLVGSRRYAVVAEDRMSIGVFMSPGAPGASWQRLLSEPVRDYYVLSASDLDGDGRPELLVYALWANDYGLHLLGDAPKPLYSFSCGNI